MPHRRWDGALLLLAVLLLWQALHWLAGGVALASPLGTAQRLAALLREPGFWDNAAATARALVWSLLIAMIGGVALGAALGANRLAAEVTEPVLLGFYALPKVTLYPLVLLLFGLGLSAKVAFGVMHGAVPVTIMTMQAVRGMRPAHLRTARVLRLGRLATWRCIVLPAIRPQLLASLRIGFALCLLGVLIGEMFASARGLGFLLMGAIGVNDGRTIMAVVVLLAGVAVAVNAALAALERA